MRGRDFLDAAHHLMAAPSEANRRAMAWPMYWALFIEARAKFEGWGFTIPPSVNVEEFVTNTFGGASIREVIQVGLALESLRDYRTSAEDCTSPAATFADIQKVRDMLFLVIGIIALLDDIEQDPTRRANAITAIRKVVP